MNRASSFSTSLWTATAEPPPATPPLAVDARTDVCIVGGGFTGLSSALHLAERGTSCLVLEAEEPGWGASGRNGGQVIPGLKHHPDAIVRDFGRDRGQRMADLAGRAADTVFEIVDRYGIACAASRCGWISAAHSRTSLSERHDLARQWMARGAPVEMLDRARIDSLTGARGYVGGLLDRRGGKLNPLSYARGLARAAQSKGCAIHGQSPAIALSTAGSSWRVETPSATVRADAVVLATNGYTDDLWPGLERTIVPVFSAQTATAPLSHNLRRTILPEGHVVSDTRRLIRYFRLDDAGRLIIGGRGRFADSGDPAHFGHIVRDARTMFPQLDEPDWQYRWSGRIAMTADHYPHLHEPAPGLICALGYNGRGVAMATAMGRVVAERVSGTAADQLPFPLTTMRQIPFHALRRPALELLILYNRLADRFGG